jgi:hypothetical protein
MYLIVIILGVMERIYMVMISEFHRISIPHEVPSTSTKVTSQFLHTFQAILIIVSLSYFVS